MKKLVREFQCPGERPGHPTLTCQKRVCVYLTDSNTLIEHANPSCKQFATLSSIEYRSFCLMKWQPDVKLYAVAVEYVIGRDDRNRDVWDKEIMHVHALNSTAAKETYMRGCTHKTYRIVEAGIVVGYFVDDEKDERKLSAQ